MSDSSYTLVEPLVHDTILRRSGCGAVCISVLSMLVGFCLGCAALQNGGGAQDLSTQEPAVSMAWSALQPGARSLFAFPNPAYPRSLLFRARPPVTVHSSPNMQNRPRQYQGNEASFVDDVEKEKEAEEAAALAALEASRKLMAEAPAPEAPYPIKIFVNSDKSSQYGVEAEDYKKGTAKFEYMETKIISALATAADKISSVDVRLNVEGHRPKAYRMEATVKYVDFNKGQMIVLSKSSHSKESFVEEVDHMHDMLKQKIRKEKEKYISKIKHARKDAEKDEPVGMVEEPDDELMVPP